MAAAQKRVHLFQNMTRPARAPLPAAKADFQTFVFVKYLLVEFIYF